MSVEVLKSPKVSAFEYHNPRLLRMSGLGDSLKAEFSHLKPNQITHIFKEYSRVQSYNENMHKYGNDLTKTELLRVITEIELHPEYKNSNGCLRTPYSAVKFALDGSIFIINNKKDHQKIAPGVGVEQKSRRLGWVYKKGEITPAKEGEEILRSSKPTPCPNVLHEAQILEEINQGSILPLYDHGIYQGKNGVEKYGMITPFCPEGDLFDVMKSRELSFRERIRSCKSLLGQMRDLHAIGYIHNDIKCENILVREDPETGALILYLGDFGTAIKINNKAGVELQGTMDYMAPEYLKIFEQFEKNQLTEEQANQIAEELLSDKKDVWAMGLVLLILFSDDPMNTIAMLSKLLNFDPREVRFHELTPAGIIDLIEKMLAPSPDNRISSAEACDLLEYL